MVEILIKIIEHKLDNVESKFCTVRKSERYRRVQDHQDDFSIYLINDPTFTLLIRE